MMVICLVPSDFGHRRGTFAGSAELHTFAPGSRRNRQKGSDFFNDYATRVRRPPDTNLSSVCGLRAGGIARNVAALRANYGFAVTQRFLAGGAQPGVFGLSVDNLVMPFDSGTWRLLTFPLFLLADLSVRLLSSLLPIVLELVFLLFGPIAVVRAAGLLQHLRL